MVGDPGMPTTTALLLPFPTLLPLCVAQTVPPTAAAAPAMMATFTHLLDHQLFCVFTGASSAVAEFVMMIEVSPGSLPRVANTCTRNEPTWPFADQPVAAAWPSASVRNVPLGC